MYWKVYILHHKNVLENNATANSSYIFNWFLLHFKSQEFTILKYWSIEVDINSDKFHKTNNYHNCSQQWLQEVR